MVGHDNFNGPFRALDGTDVARLIRYLDGGIPVPAIAEAFGISKRSVHRYRGARLETIDVAGWPMTFLVFSDPLRSPVQVSRRNAAHVA